MLRTEGIKNLRRGPQAGKFHSADPRPKIDCMPDQPSRRRRLQFSLRTLMIVLLGHVI
jgi:hypothetical protein